MKMKGKEVRILVVDDDPELGGLVVDQLSQEGFRTAYVASAELGLKALASGSYDLVVSDMRLPAMDGMALLRAVKERWSDVPVVLLTAYGSISLAVEAMRAGAAGFLVKPHARADLLATVDTALANFAWHAERPPQRPHSGLLGNAQAMQSTKRDIVRAARVRSTVLLRGETGTGKEVAARAIHAASRRAAKPFVPVHCAALPDQLLESELFGYIKGAFTGASGNRMGRVELAEGGTIFLDEIGEIQPAMQVKLLRLLQERTFEALGDSKPRTADVRFIAATHRDLESMVQAGSFREDLFYRLSVIPIWLPPLREIREDIPELATTFLHRFAEQADRPTLKFTEAAMQRLMAHAYPGNVRELESLVERLIVFTDDHRRIDAHDVDRELERQSGRIATPVANTPKDEEARRSALTEALLKAKGNRTQAARLLGISRRTLYNWLEKYDLESASEDPAASPP